MAKRPAKRKNRNSGFPPAPEKTEQKRSANSPSAKRPMRWDLLILFLTIAIGGTYLAIALRPKIKADEFTYEVLREIDHDPSAFTQGLVTYDGFLWESTGRLGESSIRKLDAETGEVLSRYDLPADVFGEGLAVHNDKFYQLTWKAGRAFVYQFDKGTNSFKVETEFKYDGEGWGLTSNGSDLILSTGDSYIKFLDPETFKERRSIRVLRPSGLPVGRLNELEFVGGRIYANKYETDWIYEIDPKTGDVTKIIDLARIWPTSERPERGAVLNGIALNPKTDKLLVTGKLCPKIFEISMFKKAK